MSSLNDMNSKILTREDPEPVPYEFPAIKTISSLRFEHLE